MAFNNASNPSSSSHNASPIRFPSHGSPSNHNPQQQQQQQQQPPQSPPFDIIEWYPHFQSCHKYFLDHAQHSGPVQALAAFLNIQLPFQKYPSPVMSSTASSPRPDHLRPHQHNPFAGLNISAQAQGVSLIPYIRRLVATGHDTPAVLHGFFGDDWLDGIGAMHEIERRNYLFAAKSTSWLKVKQAYDMNAEETVPFLSSLSNASEKEIEVAEFKWSEWLAMQDWMLGPRAPEMGSRGPRVKTESTD